MFPVDPGPSDVAPTFHALAGLRMQTTLAVAARRKRAAAIATAARTARMLRRAQILNPTGDCISGGSSAVAAVARRREGKRTRAFASFHGNARGRASPTHASSRQHQATTWRRFSPPLPWIVKIQTVARRTRLIQGDRCSRRVGKEAVVAVPARTKDEGARAAPRWRLREEWCTSVPAATKAMNDVGCCGMRGHCSSGVPRAAVSMGRRCSFVVRLVG